MYTLTYSATHSPPFIASSHVYLNEFHHWPTQMFTNCNDSRQQTSRK
jgi:hypothetical protein